MILSHQILLMEQFALEERTEFAAEAVSPPEIYSEPNFFAERFLEDWIEAESALEILGLEKFVPEVVC